MSASLVGSEMCIRDRLSGALLSGALLSGALLSGALISGALLSGARSPEPVSYTHLTLPTICSV
eukprot:11874482-Alexandrium_andersonii.AAC.1